MPRCLIGHSINFKLAVIAFFLISIISFSLSTPYTLVSAPNFKYISSDSLISSIALSYPNISGRLPPTSGDKDNLPSEKAPAPANPVVIEHGLQPTQFLVLRLGQFLF